MSREPNPTCPECGAEEPYWNGNKAEPDSLRAENEQYQRALEASRAETVRAVDALVAAKTEIERLTERGMEAEAWCNQLNVEIERLKALLKAIERHTAPGTRTWDTCLRDMGLANDLARAALEPKP